MLKIYRLSVFLVITLFSLSHVWADDYPELNHARAGFGMRPKMGAWSEVSVYLTNPSEQGREVEAVLIGQSPRSGSEKVFCRRPVYLSPRTKRQESFYGLFGHPAHFEVELYQKGIRIARDTFPIKGIDSSAPVFLIIDEMHGSYSFLSKLKIPKLSESPVAVYSNPRDLPERWIGYDGIDLIILGSFHHESLNRHQIEALKEWVSAGGKLIISSPARADRGGQDSPYQNSFVEELSNLRVLGARVVTSLPAMAQYFKKKINIDKDLYLTEVFPVNSEVILKQGEVPLILTSIYGMGKVTFLSFDAAHESLINWGGAGALWTELVGDKLNTFSEERTSLADNVEPILTGVVGVNVPGFNQVVIFLLGYLVVVILGYLIFRVIKRPELAWLVYPVVVPLAIWLFYQTGQVGKEGAQLSIHEVSLTELPPGKTEGRSLVYLGLFSPDGLTSSLVLRTPQAYGPRVSRAMPDRPLFKVIDVKEEDVFSLKDLNLAAGTLNTLSFNNIVRVGDGLNIMMMLTDEGLAGEITNRTGQVLDDCLLVYNRYVKPVGSIPNGGTIKVRMADPAEAKWHRDYSLRVIKARRDVLREKIISSLFTPPLLAKPVETDLVFLGWFSKPVFHLDAIEQMEKNEALALLLMKVPVNVQKAGTIFVPKGICDVEVVSRTIAGLFYRGKWLRSQREAEIVADFVLPPGVCRQMLGQEIKIYFQFEAADMDMKLDAYNWQEKHWVSLPVENQINLSEGRLYLMDGRVRVRIKGTPIRKVTSEGLRAGFWEVKDLDIEVKGTIPVLGLSPSNGGY